jgi:hypothetical protein
MIQFKNNKDRELLTYLNPIVIMIFADLCVYAKARHNIDLTVTQTVSTPEIDKKLGRVSPSHSQGRAIDIRTRDIDAFIVQDLVKYINSKPEYKQYHYSSNSGVNRLAYFHIGSAEHIHLAIHSRYAVPIEEID